MNRNRYQTNQGKLAAICSLFFLWLPMAAQAGETEALAALEIANKDLAQRYAAYPALRFGFVLTLESRDDVPQDMQEDIGNDHSLIRYGYDPRQQLETRFTLLSYPEKDSDMSRDEFLRMLITQETKAGSDIDEMADRSRLIGPGSDGLDTENPIFLKETAEAFIFTFTPPETLFTDDDQEGLSKQERRMMERMTKAIRGEFYIDKKSGQFDKIHLWLGKPVKIQTGISIRSMDLTMDIRPFLPMAP